MNVLNVTTMVGIRGGDMQMYTAYNLLKEYKDVNQFILCPETSDLAKMCERDHAQYYTYKKNKFKVFNTVGAIIKICRKEKIDVLHIHDSTALTYALMALKFLPSSIQLVLSRKRNNRIKDKFLNRYKYSHPRIVKIVSVSKAVEAIFDNIITDKTKLVTIYDAIDVQKYASKKSLNLIHEEYNLSPDTKIVGNIAGLTNQKDIFTFVDTAKKILEKSNRLYPIKFVVVGNGVLMDDLTAYIKELGLQGDVFLMGFRNNAADLLPEFDVFLMTSITEGLPLTIYEAFAARIPVVSTDAGGIREVLIHEKTGLMTAVKDTEALSDNVIRILKDDAFKERIVRNAYTTVIENHDLKTMKENYYKFLRSLA